MLGKQSPMEQQSPQWQNWGTSFKHMAPCEVIMSADPKNVSNFMTITSFQRKMSHISSMSKGLLGIIPTKTDWPFQD